MTLTQVGTDVYLPSLPAIKSQLMTTNTYVQLTMSLFLAGSAISQLFYGPLSDRFGRKPFLLIGVSIFFLTSIIAAFVDSITILLILRTFQGLGAGACIVIPRAIMRDRFTGKALEEMVIYQSMVWAIVPISAPLLGSYVQHYFGWRYNFLLLALFAFIGMILCLLIKETHAQIENNIAISEIINDYKKILAHKQFLLYFVCTLGVIALLTAFNVSAPLIIQETLHLSALQYGWSIFFVAASFIFGTILNRWLLDKISGYVIVRYGLLLTLTSGLLLLFFEVFNQVNLLKLLIPIFILQIGCAFIFSSNAAKIMEIFPHLAGKTAAIFGCGIFLSGALASVIISLFSVGTFFPLAIFILIISFIMIISYRMIIHK
jgi:Bcr/CflA subfamily drug resistance transporter